MVNGGGVVESERKSNAAAYERIMVRLLGEVVVGPEFCSHLSSILPIVPRGMCFSTVLLEVKHTGTSRACVSDLVPVINHNS